MNLLLDAHFAFWLALKRERLTKGELAVLLDPDTIIAVPSVAIWELRIKWEKRFVSGARKGEASPRDVLQSLQAMDIPLVDLTAEIAAEPLKEPISHSDPFDELLLTIAQQLDMKLFTRDARLRDHPHAFTAP